MTTARASPSASTPRAPRARWLVPLLTVAVLIATAVFGTRPTVSYRALELGAGTFELGAVASAFATLAIVGAVPAGRLTDRLGERWIVVIGAGLIAASCTAIVAVRSLPLLAVTQATMGLGQLMVVVGAQAILANRGGAEGREHRFGVYTSIASLGHALGPALSGALVGRFGVSTGGDLFFAVAAGAAAVAALLAVVFFPAGPAVARAHGERGGRRGSVRETLALPGMRQAMIASIVVLTSVDLLVAYLPAYGEERALPAEVIGSMLAVLALCQMASRLVMVRLIRRFGHIATLLASMIVPAVVVPVLLLPLGLAPLFVAMAVVGFGLGIGQPMSLVLIALATPPRDRGLAMGLRLGGNRLGQMTVPILLGATVGQAGVSMIILSITAMLGFTSGYIAQARMALTEARGRADRGPG